MQHLQTPCNLLGKEEFNGIRVLIGKNVDGVHRCCIERDDFNNDDKNFKAWLQKSKQGYRWIRILSICMELESAKFN